MNKLIINNDLWSKEIPCEEGKYLCKSDLYSATSLVTVVFYPEKCEYGMHWPSYYGILEYKGRNVKGLKRLWIKLEEQTNV